MLNVPAPDAAQAASERSRRSSMTSDGGGTAGPGPGGGGRKNRRAGPGHKPVRDLQAIRAAHAAELMKKRAHTVGKVQIDWGDGKGLTSPMSSVNGSATSLAIPPTVDSPPSPPTGASPAGEVATTDVQPASVAVAPIVPSPPLEVQSTPVSVAQPRAQPSVPEPVALVAQPEPIHVGVDSTQYPSQPHQSDAHEPIAFAVGSYELDPSSISPPEAQEPSELEAPDTQGAYQGPPFPGQDYADQAVQPSLFDQLNGFDGATDQRAYQDPHVAGQDYADQSVQPSFDQSNGFDGSTDQGAYQDPQVAGQDYADQSVQPFFDQSNGFDGATDQGAYQDPQVAGEDYADQSVQPSYYGEQTTVDEQPTEQVYADQVEPEPWFYGQQQAAPDASTTQPTQESLGFESVTASGFESAPSHPASGQISSEEPVPFFDQQQAGFDEASQPKGFEPQVAQGAYQDPQIARQGYADQAGQESSYYGQQDGYEATQDTYEAQQEAEQPYADQAASYHGQQVGNPSAQGAYQEQQDAGLGYADQAVESTYYGEQQTGFAEQQIGNGYADQAADSSYYGQQAGYEVPAQQEAPSDQSYGDQAAQSSYYGQQAGYDESVAQDGYQEQQAGLAYSDQAVESTYYGEQPIGYADQSADPSHYGQQTDHEVSAEQNQYEPQQPAPPAPPMSYGDPPPAPIKSYGDPPVVGNYGDPPPPPVIGSYGDPPAPPALLRMQTAPPANPYRNEPREKSPVRNLAPARPRLGTRSQTTPITAAQAANPEARASRGHCLAIFGPGGRLITTTPTVQTRYCPDGNGGTIPMQKVYPGLVKVAPAAKCMRMELLQAVRKEAEPLVGGKIKPKKKDVLQMVQDFITEAERLQFLAEDVRLAYKKSGVVDFKADADAADKRDQVLSMQLLKHVVEHDGEVLSNGKKEPAALKALLAILRPTHHDVSQGTYVEQIEAALLSADRLAAVKVAVSAGMWPYALIIASNVSKDVYRDVVLNFTRQEFSATAAISPTTSQGGRGAQPAMQVILNLFSGQGPAAFNDYLPAFDSNTVAEVQQIVPGHQLDEWRNVLAIILANRTPGDLTAVATLGDHLRRYGRNSAADFCYLVAQVPETFGGHHQTNARVVLLGADHIRHRGTFQHTPNALRKTEIYEYAMTLRNNTGVSNSLPHLQSFKLHHAKGLTDLGLIAEAQRYTEAIETVVRNYPRGSPHFHALFNAELAMLSDQLAHQKPGSISSKEPIGASSGWLSKLGSLGARGVEKFVNSAIGEADVAGARGGASQGPVSASLNGNEPPRKATYLDRPSSTPLSAGRPVSSTGYLGQPASMQSGYQQQQGVGQGPADQTAQASLYYGQTNGFEAQAAQGAYQDPQLAGQGYADQAAQQSSYYGQQNGYEAPAAQDTYQAQQPAEQPYADLAASYYGQQVGFGDPSAQGAYQEQQDAGLAYADQAADSTYYGEQQTGFAEQQVGNGYVDQAADSSYYGQQGGYETSGAQDTYGDQQVAGQAYADQAGEPSYNGQQTGYDESIAQGGYQEQQDAGLAYADQAADSPYYGEQQTGFAEQQVGNGYVDQAADPSYYGQQNGFETSGAQDTYEDQQVAGQAYADQTVEPSYYDQQAGYDESGAQGPYQAQQDAGLGFADQAAESTYYDQQQYNGFEATPAESSAAYPEQQIADQGYANDGFYGQSQQVSDDQQGFASYYDQQQQQSQLAAPEPSASAPPTANQQRRKSEGDDMLGLGNSSFKAAETKLSESPTGKDTPDSASKTQETVKSRGLFGAIGSLFGKRRNSAEAASSNAPGTATASGDGPVKANLGEKSTFHYDPIKKRWVNGNDDGKDDDKAVLAPPPKMMGSASAGAPGSGGFASLSAASPNNSGSAISLGEGASAGGFTGLTAGKRRGARNRYVDVLNTDSKNTTPSTSMSFLPPVANVTDGAPIKMMVASRQPSYADFGSKSSQGLGKPPTAPGVQQQGQRPPQVSAQQQRKPPGPPQAAQGQQMQRPSSQQGSQHGSPRPPAQQGQKQPIQRPPSQQSQQGQQQQQTQRPPAGQQQQQQQLRAKPSMQMRSTPQQQQQQRQAPPNLQQQQQQQRQQMRPQASMPQMRGTPHAPQQQRSYGHVTPGGPNGGPRRTSFSSTTAATNNSNILSPRSRGQGRPPADF
ncbi:hypothetical protein HKX48_005747 [Thoreauomyces humboldtii]|nr:hypothetical protein HKX48_005747 [Thoreauomyces humboldtii]